MPPYALVFSLLFSSIQGGHSIMMRKLDALQFGVMFEQPKEVTITSQQMDIVVEIDVPPINRFAKQHFLQCNTLPNMTVETCELFDDIAIANNHLDSEITKSHNLFRQYISRALPSVAKRKMRRNFEDDVTSGFSIALGLPSESERKSLTSHVTQLRNDQTRILQHYNKDRQYYITMFRHQSEDMKVLFQSIQNYEQATSLFRRQQLEYQYFQTYLFKQVQNRTVACLEFQLLLQKLTTDIQTAIVNKRLSPSLLPPEAIVTLINETQAKIRKQRLPFQIAIQSNDFYNSKLNLKLFRHNLDILLRITIPLVDKNYPTIGFLSNLRLFEIPINFNDPHSPVVRQDMKSPNVIWHAGDYFDYSVTEDSSFLLRDKLVRNRCLNAIGTQNLTAVNLTCHYTIARNPEQAGIQHIENSQYLLTSHESLQERCNGSAYSPLKTKSSIIVTIPCTCNLVTTDGTLLYPDLNHCMRTPRTLGAVLHSLAAYAHIVTTPISAQELIGNATLVSQYNKQLANIRFQEQVENREYLNLKRHSIDLNGALEMAKRDELIVDSIPLVADPTQTDITFWDTVWDNAEPYLAIIISLVTFVYVTVLQCRMSFMLRILKAYGTRV
jgi:hypothetical protein